MYADVQQQRHRRRHTASPAVYVRNKNHQKKKNKRNRRRRRRRNKRERSDTATTEGPDKDTRTTFATSSPWRTHVLELVRTIGRVALAMSLLSVTGKCFSYWYIHCSSVGYYYKFVLVLLLLFTIGEVSRPISSISLSTIES